MYGNDVRDFELLQLRMILGVAVVAHIQSRQDLMEEKLNKRRKDSWQLMNELHFPYASPFFQYSFNILKYVYQIVNY